LYEKNRYRLLIFNCGGRQTIGGTDLCYSEAAATPDLTKFLFFGRLYIFERLCKESILLKMLQFFQVRKHYNGRPILSIPALNLANGVYWLQGTNGSGKTTLLRMIAGLIPFEGDIFFEDVSLRHKPLDYRRKIAWAEAEPLYPDFLTGTELINFYQEIRKAPAGQADRLSFFLGMQPWLATPVSSYSSGMVKRLSLLLAFLGEPALILLDEPLATLDAEAAFLLPDLIREYHQEHGTGFIFSSHHAFNSGSLGMEKKLLITGKTIH
jgi:ABC-2 type transport system ATP-binding protein